jgi:SAM-dependent methyltransferase
MDPPPTQSTDAVSSLEGYWNTGCNAGNPPLMRIVHRLLRRMFGRPQGLLGRVGGIIMARLNQPCALCGIDLLAVQPHDCVLQVGFGPGVGIALLAQATSAGYVAGVDASSEMVAQATARNRHAIKA